MCPPTGFDSVRADSHRRLCRSPAWPRLSRSRHKATPPATSTSMSVVLPAGSSPPGHRGRLLLAAMQEFSSLGAPEVWRLLITAVCGHPSDLARGGRAVPLCPGRSDVDLFRDGEGVIDLNAEVAHRALDLLVPQQN